MNESANRVTPYVQKHRVETKVSRMKWFQGRGRKRVQGRENSEYR